MNLLPAIKRAVIVLLIFLLAVPGEVSGQEKGAGPPFGKEELSRILASIALYPDSLLANVLVAATFPLEVVSADRWVKQNKDLKGEQLDAALVKMKWDLSVKALVPFPEVLAMMSEKLDWTQALGAAFLEQQKDVMDTVQKLRARARAEGNLKSSSEQKVVDESNTITIEPANPTTIYVPSYNPEVVYGAWPYPAYPPYAYSPYGGAVAAGVLGFAAGVAVGAAWNGGWGNWNWGGGTVNVNVNRNFNINGNRVSHYQTGKWNQARRGGVSAGNSAARRKGSAAATRGNFRGRSPNRSPSAGAGRPKTSQRPSGAKGPKGASQASSRRRGQSVSGRPSASSGRRGSRQGRAGGAFQGMGHSGYTRRSSQRGSSSRQASMGRSGGRGLGGGRGGFSGGGRGGRTGGGGGRRR
ncbi:MAG: DUF3300 domain-containing protein [Syntrophobacteraceae bacterium]|nr:DUF3300 domain-containing protein [Syntrophobacteraceae bacterium]